jgi:sugar-phosphatase
MTRPVEAVVFDMDGVLVDSEPLWREVEREVARGLGFELTDTDLEATTGVRIGEVVRGWHDRWPWERPPVEDVARSVVDGVGAAVRDRGAVLPGAVEAVRYARGVGVRVALASSSPRSLIGVVVERLGLAGAFDVLHSAESDAYGKPAPDAYLTTAGLLRVAPAACLAVEDSRIGVRAALAAGMRCVAVPERLPADGRFHGADLVLRSLEEFGPSMWEALDAEPVPVDRSRA